ncbi:MAG: aminotransferase class V-fold PLP-dependent enzyme [Nibricoccus sp.]
MKALSRKKFLQQAGGGALGLILATQGGSVEDRQAPDFLLPEYSPGAGEALWRKVREQYAMDPAQVYLNCGGLGPPLMAALRVRDAIEKKLRPKVESGHALFEESRRVAADFFGAGVDEVCFTRNATEGNSIIASGLNLQAGDEVVFDSHAHPGGSLPWLNRARQHGVVIRTFEPSAESAEDNVARIAALITPRTRVIQVSHVTAPTGLLLPVRLIATLAHAHGLWFHVDGAQSAGMIPVNLHELGCDSYATSGHKWLGAPCETGVLYVRQEKIEDVAPQQAGAYSTGEFDFSGRFEFSRGARRFEYGTRSAAVVAGLVEAMRFQNAIGRDRIAAYGQSLAARVREGLAPIHGISVLTPNRVELASSMVTFRIEGVSCSQVFDYLLAKHHLRCRPVTELNMDAIRVSTHVFNTSRDCDQLIAAVAGHPALG